MNYNTSIAPERDQKLLEEFSLSAVPTLRKLLSTIDEDEHELYVYLQSDHTQFVTEILNIDWNSGLMWLGTPYEKSLSNKCNASTAYVMVSFPDGVKVQFAGMGILQSEYQGADALRVAIPRSIVRLQRRNYFRVMADEELNSQVKIDIPTVNSPISLVDIS
ncbi:MAG: flagellar regulator YcgR PilZN domain-containing protein, partial [Limnobacter sp.]